MFDWFSKHAVFRKQSFILLGFAQLYNVLQIIVALFLLYSRYMSNGTIDYHDVVNIALLVLAAIILCSVWILLNRVQVRPIESLVQMKVDLENGREPDVSIYSGGTNCVSKVADILLSFHEAFKEQKETENRMNEVHQQMTEREEKTHAVIKQLQQDLDYISKGDLSVRITNHIFDGEFAPIRDAFNDSVEKLGVTLVTVSDSSSMLTNGASEIATASDDLAKRTERQAASLGQITASMKSVSAGLKNTSDNCASANEETNDTLKKVKAASEGMDNANIAMGEIKTSSDNVVQITRSVSDIAFKTNVLALNASVEAARAGDAGRGFAVVAKEVQILAEQSAKAAEQIRDVLDKSTTHVQNGVDIVANTAGLLKDVQDVTDALAVRINEVASVTEEQAISLEEVTKAVSNMDSMTQQNAAMVEESTAASHNLTTQTKKLQRLLTNFVISRSLQRNRLEEKKEEQSSLISHETPLIDISDVKSSAHTDHIKTSSDDKEWENF